MHCPSCGTEYRSGFTVCSDCHVALAEGTPSERAPAKQSKVAGADGGNVVPVYTTNRIHADMIRALLEGSGIPAILSKEGYSSAYPLTVGTLGSGRVLVREEDRDRALEVIAAAEGGDLSIESETDEPESLRFGWWVLALVILMLIAIALVRGTVT